MLGPGGESHLGNCRAVYVCESMCARVTESGVCVCVYAHVCVRYMKCMCMKAKEKGIQEM